MLTAAEIQVLNEAGFKLEVGEFIRSHASNPIEKASPVIPFSGEAVKMTGISIGVKDGDEAENVFNRVQPGLISRGFRAFWSKRHEANGLDLGDELVVLQTTDDTDIVCFKQTDGANYDITNSDILDRLQAWRSSCQFDIVGADHDFVVLRFSQLPEGICDFVSEVNDFCPDAAGQGVAVDRDFNTPANLETATRLCPEVKVTPREMSPLVLEQFGDDFAELYLEDQRKNVRLLALKLRESKELFLWWD